MKLILMPYEKEIPIEIEKFSFENGAFSFSGRMDGRARFSLNRVRKQGDENRNDLELQIGKWLSVLELSAEVGTEKAADEIGWAEADIYNLILSKP